MLIPKNNTMAQASLYGQSSSNGLANDGKPIVVSVPLSDSTVAPGVSTELPRVAVAQIAEQQVFSAHLQSVSANINKVLKQLNRNLEFTVDTSTEKAVIKLIESDTGHLIRQYPTEEMLAVSSAIENFQQNVLLKHEA